MDWQLNRVLPEGWKQINPMTVRAEGNNTEGKPVDMGDRLDNDDSSTGSMKDERTHKMENEAQTSKWLNSMAETDRGLAGDNKTATRLADEATFRNITRTKARLKLIAYRFNQSKALDAPAPQKGPPKGPL